MMINFNKVFNSPQKFFRQLVLVLFLLPLFSCSLLKSNSSFSSIADQHSAFFELMPVPEALQDRIWLDKFRITFEGAPASHSPQNMLLQIELTKNTINIAAMSFTGIPIAQAYWRVGTNELVNDTTLNMHLDLKQVLQDLQSVNWPLAQLKSALLIGYSVNEELLDDVKIRRIYYDNRLIVKITKHGNKISFAQLERGYEFSVVRLEDNSLKIAESADSQ